MPRGPVDQRHPGVLPRLLSVLRGEKKERIPNWAIKLAQEADAINQKVWMCLDNSLPAAHGFTHLGGSDSIAGHGLPAPIGVGIDPTRGKPQVGLAPHDHVHEVDLGGLEDLLDLDTEGGVNVQDLRLRRLLEAILLQVIALEEFLLNDRGNEMLRSVALPPRTITSDTASQIFLPENALRMCATIVNVSSQTLYVGFQDETTTTNFSYAIATNQTFELPEVGIINKITGAWAAANGSAQVTEHVRA